jgi:hypothetical protein
VSPPRIEAEPRYPGSAQSLLRHGDGRMRLPWQGARDSRRLNPIPSNVFALPGSVQADRGIVPRPRTIYRISASGQVTIARGTGSCARFGARLRTGFHLKPADELRRAVPPGALARWIRYGDTGVQCWRSSVHRGRGLAGDRLGRPLPSVRDQNPDRALARSGAQPDVARCGRVFFGQLSTLTPVTHRARRTFPFWIRAGSRI